MKKCIIQNREKSHQDNISIDGLDEYENKRREDTEDLLLETFSNHLRLENAKIERTHRVGYPKVSTKRTIVAKLAIYKDKQKQKTPNKYNRLKGTGIYLNEAFLNETVEIKKQNWDRVKTLRYDRIYTR